MEEKLKEFKEMFEQLPYEEQIKFIETVKEYYGIDLEENREIRLNK